MVRPLTVKSNAEAEASGWDVVIKDEDANPDGWELVQKASYDGEYERVLHTTKRRRVPGGWIYETYTELVLKAATTVVGSVEIPSQPSATSSKAMCFVPEEERYTKLRAELLEIEAELRQASLETAGPTHTICQVAYEKVRKARMRRLG